MNLLSWNCRGGGNSWTVRDLATLVKSHSPTIVFLCETRQSVSKMKRYRARLGLQGFDGVDSNGNSGGLALYWHESLTVEVKFSNARCIDAVVNAGPDVPPWRLTCVYGEPRVEYRHLMWSLLKNMCASSDLPWLVVGDFNECMWDFEHVSLSARAPSQMQAFRDVLDTCDLADLGFTGVPHTYDNTRSGNSEHESSARQSGGKPSLEEFFCQCYCSPLNFSLFGPCAHPCFL